MLRYASLSHPRSISATRRLDHPTSSPLKHHHQHRNRYIITLAAASSHPHGFDLPLAVSLAYTSFEAYLQPTGAEGYEDIALNGTKTTFADGDFLNQVYSGVLFVKVISASSLKAVDITGKSDPYAIVSVNSSSRSTPIVWQDLNPVWGTRMALYVTDPTTDLLKIRVYDKGVILKGDEDLGYAILPVSSLLGRIEANQGEKEEKSLFDTFLGVVGGGVRPISSTGQHEKEEGVVEVKLEGPGSGNQGASVKIKVSYLPFEKFEAETKASMTANDASPPPAPSTPIPFSNGAPNTVVSEKKDLLSNVERLVLEDERRRRRDRLGQVGSFMNTIESLSTGVKSFMNPSNPSPQPTSPSVRATGDSPWKALTVMAGVPQDTLFKPLAFVESEETDTQAWLFANAERREAVVAFRGTEQIKWKDLLTDLNLAPCVLSPERLDEDAKLPFGLKIFKAAMGSDTELKVHSGFLQGYDSVKRPLIALLDKLTSPSNDSNRGKWRVLVTGHSLGGALATLCAYELSSRRGPSRATQDITMYTFGAPRAGNAPFAAAFNSLVPDSWRISNHRDIVPSVPRLLGYCHVKHSVRLTSDGGLTIEADGGKDVFGEGRGGLDVIQDLIAKSQRATTAEGGGDDIKGGWESVYGEVAAKEMEIFAALADGSALEQHMEMFYLETLRAVVLANMKK